MEEKLTPNANISEQFRLSFLIELDGYEGPIDLLLSLAREQKVDLTRIAILPLAEQYLKFIEKAQSLDLEIAADYLVMATWLAYLKSRLILPDSSPEETSEMLNITDELRFKLQKLEAMQNASKMLMRLSKLHTSRLTRGMPEQISILNRVKFTANLYDLLSAYGAIRSSMNTTTLTVVATNLYSVQEAIVRLRKIIFSGTNWTEFSNYLPAVHKDEAHYTSGVSAHFGAVLELVKEGTIQFKQDFKFSPIMLRKKEK